MANKSRLHIPKPTARPGDEPDFSYLDLSPAGAVEKPPVAARTRDVEFLSSGLVRVLDDEHQAVGPWNPLLDHTQLQVALRWMMKNRVFDQRMWQIQRQGRISFYMEAAGEEAISIAQGMALRRPDLVEALVLCCTGMKIGTADAWNTRIAAARRDGLASIADGIIERWFSTHYRAAHPIDVAGYRNMLIRTPADGYAAVCAAIRDCDLSARAGSITQPTTCIAGTEDEATPPEVVEALSKALPNAQYHVLDGVGHLPCIEAPEAIAAAINAL